MKVLKDGKGYCDKLIKTKKKGRKRVTICRELINPHIFAGGSDYHIICPKCGKEHNSGVF